MMLKSTSISVPACTTRHFPRVDVKLTSEPIWAPIRFCYKSGCGGGGGGSAA